MKKHFLPYMLSFALLSGAATQAAGQSSPKTRSPTPSGKTVPKLTGDERVKQVWRDALQKVYKGHDKPAPPLIFSEDPLETAGIHFTSKGGKVSTVDSIVVGMYYASEYEDEANFILAHERFHPIAHDLGLEGQSAESFCDSIAATQNSEQARRWADKLLNRRGNHIAMAFMMLPEDGKFSLREDTLVLNRVALQFIETDSLPDYKNMKQVLYYTMAKVLEEAEMEEGLQLEVSISRNQFFKKAVDVWEASQHQHGTHPPSKARSDTVYRITNRVMAPGRQ